MKPTIHIPSFRQLCLMPREQRLAILEGVSALADHLEKERVPVVKRHSQSIIKTSLGKTRKERKENFWKT